MATKHFRIVVRFIQWRRNYARRRLLRDMGWRDYWTQVQTRKFT